MTTKLKTLMLFTVSTLLLSVTASATPVLFTGSSGNLTASVSFDVSGSDLIVTLTNTSTADVLVPDDVLTAVFFNITGDPTLTRISALLNSGSTVWFGTAPGGVVGGEWAYSSGLSGAPLGVNQGISSSGLSLFGPFDLFPGTNLQGPASPDGLQYGLTSAGDNPATGNAPVTGAEALIHNSVVLTLGGLPNTFSLGSISNVWFQYGTSLTEPGFQGTTGGQVPEPGTLGLLGAGLAAVAVRRWQRRARA